MARFCSLYSSSSGNSTYIGTEDGGILIDIGVTAKKTENALMAIGVDPSTIGAVFVTHEHSDHIGGVRVFASKHNTKVYASEGTLNGMDEYGVFKSPVDAYIIPSCGIDVCGMHVTPFKTSHDSYESNGYTIEFPDGKKASVCTDLGIVTDTVAEAVMGSDLILLESNHDVSMLRMGPYPVFLKQRILSKVGHLSNDVCSEFATELFNSGTKYFILGHLSKENNIPSLAFETTNSALKMAGGESGRDYFLSVAGDLNDPIEF